MTAVRSCSFQANPGVSLAIEMVDQPSPCCRWGARADRAARICPAASASTDSGALLQRRWLISLPASSLMASSTSAWLGCCSDIALGPLLHPLNGDPMLSGRQAAASHGQDPVQLMIRDYIPHGRTNTRSANEAGHQRYLSWDPRLVYDATHHRQPLESKSVIIGPGSVAVFHYTLRDEAGKELESSRDGATPMPTCTARAISFPAWRRP